MMHQVAMGAGSVAAAAVVAITEPGLGVTWSALILFVSGATGAWARAALSPTQETGGWPWYWGKRMVADALIGGATAVLLPLFATKLLPILGVDLGTMTAVHQGALALLLGGSGSYFWTVIGWRKGLIVTPEQASTGQKPEAPPVGVLRGTKEADVAAAKFEAEEAQDPEGPRRG